MENFSIVFGIIFWPTVICWWVIQCRRGRFSRLGIAISFPFVFGLPLLATLSMAHWVFVSEALYPAACEGDVERVKTLLARGADPDTDLEGLRALPCAAGNGKVEVVRVLLAHGADVKVRNAFGGYTALRAAKENGHLEVVKLLRAAGAKE